jgi:hypothetical protein
MRVKKKLSATNILISLITGKCKTVSAQAWTGPGGFRMLRLPDLTTIGI